MSYSVMFALLLLTPLLFSLLCFACRKRGLSATCTVTVLHSLGITLLLILALWVVQTAADAGEIFAAGLWLHIDGLGGLFLAILGVIGFLTGVYSIGYMRHEVAHGELSPVTLCDYYGFFHLFLFTMLLVVTSNNLIVMWAAIEATTLSSAFLVGIYGQRSSLESAWKYIIICTVGVAFGLFGTVLVYANAASVMPQAEMAISWSEVLKQSSLLDPTLMLLAFVFVLIGFGTKTGLFPMHAWLPDAHSEAPSPVSALLSAVLLNCALLVLIRYYIIICQAIGSDFPNRLLLIFGMLSVAVAAFFILVQRDIKRLLAYSSVENMGLVAVALGIGGPLGIFAALLHTLNHSLAKTRMGYNEVTFLSDRVCGICGFAHSVAYTNSVENALGIEVPQRAHTIRSILLEVERLHSHLLNLGLSCHFVGFDTGFMQFFRVREKSMTMAELLTGSSKTYGLNLIGGVRRDILKEQRLQTLKLVREMRADVSELVEMLLATPNMEQRTQGIGILDRQIARDYSPVGPLIRAVVLPVICALITPTPTTAIFQKHCLPLPAAMFSPA